MTAKVDAVVYFRIADPIAAVIKAENARDSTFRISQSTLRDVLGTKTLAELLAERDAISEQLGVSIFLFQMATNILIHVELVILTYDSSLNVPHDCANFPQQLLDEATDRWGVKVQRVEM